MKLTKFTVALAAATTLWGAALAQTQPVVSNPTGIVKGYDFSHIEPMVKELGMTTELATFAQPGIGEATVLVGRSGGTIIIFLPWACNNPNADKCAGLIMRSYYSTATSDAMRNAFNSKWQMTSAIGDGDVTYLQRYLIGDYGYTRGAFAVNLLVFARTAGELLTAIQGGGATSNQISLQISGAEIDAPQAVNAPPGKPMPGDDVADALNATQKIGNLAPMARSEGLSANAPQTVAADLSFDDRLHASIRANGFSIERVSDATIDQRFRFGHED